MDTLQEAVVRGIIDMDAIRKQLDMLTKKEVLSKHPYKITHLPSGRYQTYYIRGSGKRLTVRAKSEEALIDKLVSLYLDGEKEDLSMLFEKWLVYKRSITGSPNTIKRHRQHYNKYLKETKLFKKNIKDIHVRELNAFCNDLVKTHKLTHREWVNVKTILLGLFDYAVDEELITSSPMSRVKITVRFKQVVKKSDGSKIFNKDESRDFKEYLLNMHEETGDLSFLAVYVNFYLGLRIGELTSLRWCDISDSYVHVEREEVRDQEKNIYVIEDHTKGYMARDVVLVPQAKKIFDQIRGDHAEDEYVFTRNGKRLTSRQITYVYEKYGRAIGKVKRSHTVRRTYASDLEGAGVPIDEIRRELGHRDISTTLGYIFNTKTEDETARLITDAFSS